ncbi:MAG TPA: BREX-3 system P-loop-containing protein BrxF [Actinomycetota bacterium]|nr:BREX-3 system P-loop-containing protein BrxF [Actinomycetota bacterium]
MERSAERWPGAAAALRDELAGRPGRLALVCGEDAERTAERIAEALGVSPTRVGGLLTAEEAPPAPSVVAELLSTATVLMDCEILFDRGVGVDPLQLLRALARRAPRIAVWPGRIASGRTTYSEPGRRDHYERELADTLVIRPRHTAFPDEVPYTVERIP